METPAITQPRGLYRSANKWELVLYAVLLWFSTWLMFKTFSYKYDTGEILISSKIWSDFGASLPLIRSFSLGDNWPPEYPIFPGEPIRYHFLFFYFVGILEKLGLPIHWALNIPSTLGFFAILSMIYVLGKRLFHDARVGLFSIVFFVFNGSLAFLQFFAKHPLSASTLNDIVTNNNFTAMGPWDGGKVLGFWQLNVFINQRHFVVALGILMLFMFACLWLENRSRRSHVISAIIFGVVIGFFPLFHKPVTLMFAVTMTVFFLLLPYLRVFLFVSGAVSLGIMGILWLTPLTIAGNAGDVIRWHPGLTVYDTLSLSNMLSFFWYQFGLHCLLAPIGFFLAPRRAKIFLLPALLIFTIAFLFQFSSDILANHKFINFGIIMMQMLSAYTIFRAYDFILKRGTLTATVSVLRKVTAMVFVSVFTFFLTLTGLLDIFAIITDSCAHVPDIRSNPEARWFMENTPKDAVVLNSAFFYHPANIAGRKIFLGWAYFTVTAGYAHGERGAIIIKIYAGENPDVYCPLLRNNNISYMTVEDNVNLGDDVPINYKYFRNNFKPAYVSANGKYAIYVTEQLCASVAPSTAKQN